jgi:hypothetical protein
VVDGPGELSERPPSATAFEEAFCSSDPLCSDQWPSSDGAEARRGLPLCLFLRRRSAKEGTDT